MANININEINTESPKDLIDLKAEGEKANSSKFSAFTTLRGGTTSTCCLWTPCG
jgi:hypothetical protein